MSRAPLTIAVGAQRLRDMYFLPGRVDLPGWVEKRAPVVLPGSTSSAAYVFTDKPARDYQIRDALVRAIRHASRKVLFCSFLFGDAQIVDALVEAAERLHGGVYVLTALDKSLKIDTADLGEDLLDLAAQQRAEREREQRDRHFENLGRMARAGVWLRSARDCHAKLCVVDDEVAIVTSANATERAYEINPENGVVVGHAGVARELGRLFAHAWLHLTAHESPPGAALDLKEKASRASRPPLFPSLTGSGAICPVGTVQGVETSICDATLDLIRDAKRELIIASYSAVSLRDHAVGQALRQALQRGVQVLLVLRPRNLHRDQTETCAFLFEGIPDDRFIVLGHQDTHAKAIVADGARSLVWTGNLDGKAGYESGIEAGVMMTDPICVAATRSHVVAIARRATHKSALRPALHEIAAYEKRRITGTWELRLPADTRVGPPALAELFRKEPVFYADLGPGRQALRLGDAAEVLVRVDESARLLTAERVTLPAPPERGRADGLMGRCDLTIVEEEVKRPASAPRARRGKGGGR